MLEIGQLVVKRNNENAGETWGELYWYNPEWGKNFPWLHFHEERQLLFCCRCRQASVKIQGDDPYIMSPFIKWFLPSDCSCGQWLDSAVFFWRTKTLSAFQFFHHFPCSFESIMKNKNTLHTVSMIIMSLAWLTLFMII